jgi:hypothetical protein
MTPVPKPETRLREAIAALKASTANVAAIDTRIAGFSAEAEDLRQSAARKRVEATDACAVALVSGKDSLVSNNDPGAVDEREGAALTADSKE